MFVAAADTLPPSEGMSFAAIEKPSRLNLAGGRQSLALLLMAVDFLLVIGFISILSGSDTGAALRNDLLGNVAAILVATSLVFVLLRRPRAVPRPKPDERVLTTPSPSPSPHASDRSPAVPERQEMYLDLRRMALSAVDSGLSQPSAAHPNVSGVVVDVPAQGGFATLVALTDNTTSLYTSTGGGTIGLGGHEPVAEATQELQRVAETHLAAFIVVDVGDFPSQGHVRFHLLAPAGGRFVDVPEASFWGREAHPLMPLITAAQTVMTRAREFSPPPTP